MKRIVLLFDGTWNTLQNPHEATNVVRVGQAVKEEAKDGTKQVVYYNSAWAAAACWTRSSAVCSALA
jgi:uncharacterized protein (DUF2235 family)